MVKASRNGGAGRAGRVLGAALALAFCLSVAVQGLTLCLCAPLSLACDAAAGCGGDCGGADAGGGGCGDGMALGHVCDHLSFASLPPAVRQAAGDEDVLAVLSLAFAVLPRVAAVWPSDGGGAPQGAARWRPPDVRPHYLGLVARVTHVLC